MEESPYLTGREQLIEKYGYLAFLGSRNQRYLAQLLSISRLQRYDAGEIITMEGEYDYWAYILLEGEVQVTKEGREIARLNHPGETFGEMVLIDNAARSASVEAVTETICLAIDGSRMEGLDASDRDGFYAEFYRLLAQTLALRLRSTSTELVRERARRGRGG